jgi:hypothetical protein
MLVREGFIRLRNEAATPTEPHRRGHPRRCRAWVTRSRSACRTSRSCTPTRTSCGRSPRPCAAAPPPWAAGRGDHELLRPVGELGGAATYESAVDGHLQVLRAPPPDLKYTRRRTSGGRSTRSTTPGSPHADLHGIDAEAAELLEKDPAAAERFFGNRIVYGAGPGCRGRCLGRPRDPPDSTARANIVVGFDGSDTDDWTADPGADRGRLPVHPVVRRPAARASGIRRSTAVRSRASRSPPLSTRCARRSRWCGSIWTRRGGSRRSTPGRRVRREGVPALGDLPHHADAFGAAAVPRRRHKTDTAFTHDGDPIVATHVRNARKLARPARSTSSASRHRPRRSTPSCRQRSQRGRRRRHRGRRLAEAPSPPQGHRHALRGDSGVSPTTELVPDRPADERARVRAAGPAGS